MREHFFSIGLRLSPWWTGLQLSCFPNSLQRSLFTWIVFSPFFYAIADSLCVNFCVTARASSISLPIIFPMGLSSFLVACYAFRQFFIACVLAIIKTVKRFKRKARVTSFATNHGERARL
jgi:hypothetical protein